MKNIWIVLGIVGVGILVWLWFGEPEPPKVVRIVFEQGGEEELSVTQKQEIGLLIRQFVEVATWSAFYTDGMAFYYVLIDEKGEEWPVYLNRIGRWRATQERIQVIDDYVEKAFGRGGMQ